MTSEAFSPSVKQAVALFAKDDPDEALSMLVELQKAPHPVKEAYLMWAVALVVSDTIFKYLALEAARKEIKLCGGIEATNLAGELLDEAAGSRIHNDSANAKISFIGIVEDSTIDGWMRCIEALSFQRYANVELVLVSMEQLPAGYTFPSPAVHYQINERSKCAAYEEGIKRASGAIVSILEDPYTTFSDSGLYAIPTVFDSIPAVKVIQTERIGIGAGEMPFPMRFNFPIWNAETLFNTRNLEPPTKCFSWQGVFFKKEILLSVLPFDRMLADATALDIASRLILFTPIHTVHTSALVTRKLIEAKAPALTVKEISDSVIIMEREKKRNHTASHQGSGLKFNEPKPKTMTLPGVAPEVLVKGEKSNARITLVTPVFNGKEYIERCIDSILSQGYPNLEYMILDGGSTDGTYEIVQRYAKHLSYLRSYPDAGHYAAVQEGLNRSTGSIMGWLNADDLLCPYTFRLVASIFSESSPIRWVSGRAALITERDELDICAQISEITFDRFLNDKFDDPYIQQEGTFWTRDLWEAAGSSLDLRLKLAGDLELWARFFQHDLLYITSVPLGIFRKRTGQRSEVFNGEYLREAVAVMEKLKSAQISAPPSKNDNSLLLDIPTVSQP